MKTKEEQRKKMQKDSYERAMESDLHPYLMYRTGNSPKDREEHATWDGLILPKRDTWWNAHLPHNDLDCNCQIIAVTEDRKKRYEVEGIPVAPQIDGTGGGMMPVKTVVPTQG